MSQDQSLAEGLEDAELGRVLAAAAAPAVSPGLERRILEGFDRHWARHSSFGRVVRGIADAIWPGAPVWQPLGALAAALLVGLGVAIFAPFDIPQQDDGTSSVYALDGAPDVDAGQGI